MVDNSTVKLHQCKNNNQDDTMNTFITVTVALAMALLGVASAGLVSAPLALAPAPVAFAAPAAAVGYAHAVPQNVPPFASRVDISSRVRAAPLVALPAPVFAAAAPAPIVAAAPALPYAAAPFFR